MLASRSLRSAGATRAQRRGITTTRRCSRALTTRVRAEKSGFAKFSDAVGMNTEDGYFGFTPFSEMWVGRWSMLGFLSSMCVEFATGKGTLAQIGLEAPSTPLLVAMIAVFGGATVVGTVATVQQLVTRKMSRSQAERYRSFLGLTKKDDWMADSAAKALRGGGGFTDPGLDMAAVEATAREMKAGAVATEEAEPAAAAPSPAPAQPATFQPKNLEQQLYGLDEGQYARDVELSNGRAAMVGFLAAVLVEAATGKGILAQGIMYLKWSGILGPMSGF